MWRRFFAATLLITIIFTQAGAALGLANISRSFNTSDPNIAPGCLVSTQTGQNGGVTLANTGNGERLLGVVVPAEQSLLAIDAGNAQVQVALSGVTDTLVSTLGGDIKTGDEIAVSPISGVGMKTGNGMRTVGIAQGKFDSSSQNAQKRSLTDKNSHSSDVYIGTIPVAIVIGYAASSNIQQGFLADVSGLATALSGHQVSSTQAILSFLIALVTLAALTALVYGAINGSLTSIGRNPLSRNSIYRSLIQVVAMAVLIVVVAVAVIYLILR